MGNYEKAFTMAQYALFSTAICIVIVFAYALIWRKGKRIGIEDTLLIITLIVVSSLRYGVGSDYFRYLESSLFAARRFSDLRNLFSMNTLNRYSFEVGYETLAVLTSRVFHSQYAIFWVVSTIIYVLTVIYCRKYTDNSKIAFATFMLYGFWGLSLNIIKQAIAMSIVLFVYEALKRKKYIVSIALSIVAMSFHITSLIAVAGLLVIHTGVLKRFLQPTRRNLFRMILIGILFRFATQLFIRILDRISLYSQYTTYLTADPENEISRKFIWVGALLETIIVCGILNSAIKRKDELICKNRQIESVLSVIMLGIPFSIIGVSRTLWLANRFAKFFFLFLIVLLPTLLGNSREHKQYTFRINGQLYFWFAMIIWHAFYSVLMLDNNQFLIQTYLFG